MKSFWQTLTPKEQTIIEESAQEAAQFHRDLLRENESKMIKELEEAGMEIIYPDTAPFKEKVDGVYDSFRNLYGDEIVDRILEAAE